MNSMMQERPRQWHNAAKECNLGGPHRHDRAGSEVSLPRVSPTSSSRISPLREQPVNTRLVENSDVTDLLRAEHEQIAADLNVAMGKTGEIAHVARQLMQICLPHFALEEEIVFPILARLRAAASCEDPQAALSDLAGQLALFRRERVQLHGHHESVAACVKKLLAAAYRQGSQEVTQVAHLLTNHERSENDLELAAHELGMLPGD